MSDIKRTTLGDLVAEIPARSRVFEKFALDYCCGGQRTLEAACAQKGISAEQVIAELDALGSEARPPEVDWRSQPLDRLVDHIEQTHHVFLRREMPRVAELAAKVAMVHGENHPELLQVTQIYSDFQDEMFAHLSKEENVLFPLMRAIASGQGPGGFHCGSVTNPIRVMLAEHDSAGLALGILRKLTGNFTPPPDACGSYLALLDGLASIEADTHQHIHVENNILFPKAVGDEQENCTA